MDKVVLAYSGGLDTSLCVHWLRTERNLRVIAFTANIGQGDFLNPLAELAARLGAESAHIVDLRERYLEEFIFPALKSGARYETGNYLAAALVRPLIVSEMVALAREGGARVLAHGGSGHGNNQFRFEASIAALAPDLQVIAPLREWRLKTRPEQIEYAKRHRLPVSTAPEAMYRVNRNLWSYAVRSGDLEDAWAPPPKAVYLVTKSPEEAPDEPAEVELSFRRGEPVALNGSGLSPLALVERLNRLGGDHGIGRLDVVENRILTVKSREIYEAPAACILHAAHRALEEIVLPRAAMKVKDELAATYAEIVYNGLWYAGIRKALQAFFDETQESVEGDVRLKLYKGSCSVLGRRSPRSLYDEHQRLLREESGSLREAAEHYLKVWGLPIKAEARQATAATREREKTKILSPGS